MEQGMDEGAQYFRLDPDAVATEPGRFVDTEVDVEPVEFLPGLVFRSLIGKDVMVNFVRYQPHTEAPRHAHKEEQILFVLEGELEVELGDQTRTLRPGQAALIPPNVPHGARTHDGSCLQVDVFHPPRQAFLDLIEGRRRAASG
jgi:quercetin dioxygenase-like cupin family protein